MDPHSPFLLDKQERKKEKKERQGGGGGGGVSHTLCGLANLH